MGLRVFRFGGFISNRVQKRIQLLKQFKALNDDDSWLD